ncbi:MAG: helix-turn-helix domain-containing protein [Salinarimonadaceae bacterium]|nr:MAG: helix-turn-helix domain-containing protein [Salinarimonadaceae bacterium]
MPLRQSKPRLVERRRWPRNEASADDVVPARSPVLKPLAFSTRELAPEDQFAAWTAHVQAIEEVSLPEGADPSAGFIADHTAWNLGGMLIVQQNAPAHRYSRTVEQLRSNALDHWYVVLLRTGQMWTSVDGQVAINRPKGIHFASLGQSFSGRATRTQALILYIPRDLFEATSVALDSVSNLVLSGNSAILLADYLSSVEARLPDLAAEDLPFVVNATRDMILACLDPLAAESSASDQLANMALTERARRFVQSKLSVKKLTPGDMARALGVSRTRLYQLFEPSGGVLHYVQKRRLYAAHVALGDPADNRRINDIAEDMGFASAASFSRSFSKEFGYSPRETRNKLQVLRSYHARQAPSPEQASFTEWLKMLE